MSKYRLQVTSHASNDDADTSYCRIVQDDVFEHGSDLKHGLQRKASTAILNEDYRDAFNAAKWTNEDVTIGDNTITMMHKAVFEVDNTMQLTLQQVDDETEVTVEGTTRQVNTEKNAFALEFQSQDDGELNVDSSDVVYAANLIAAKLQVNGKHAESGYNSSWSKMPYGGIYKNHDDNGSILVLRPISAEEAAELGEEASE